MRNALARVPAMSPPRAVVAPIAPCYCNVHSYDTNTQKKII